MAETPGVKARDFLPTLIGDNQMKQRTHKEEAQRRADLRVARKARHEHGISVSVTMDALKRQRVVKPAQPEPSPLLHTRGMHPLVHHKLRGLDAGALRAAGHRALQQVMTRYRISRLFTPLDDASYHGWYEVTESALKYRRRTARARAKGETQPLRGRNAYGMAKRREHQAANLPEPVAEMIDLELALIFIRSGSRWSACRAIHTPRQYGVFLEGLAELNNTE